MNEDIRRKFLQVKMAGQRATIDAEIRRTGDLAVVAYMRELLQSDPDHMTAAFCHWNISDSYAMLRDSENEYANHRQFVQLLSQMEPAYWFWSVCDTTQKFTLESGDHGAFWWDAYRRAVAENAVLNGIEPIVFSVHRAAMAHHPSLNQNKTDFAFARTHFADFITKTEKSDKYGFYKTVYTACCINLYGECEFDLSVLCEQLLPLLKTEDTKISFVPGEWEYQNGKRSAYRKAVIGITAGVNALITANRLSAAKELYICAKDMGLPDNAHVDMRLTL